MGRTSVELQDKFAVGVCRQGRLVNLIHVFADCGNELSWLNRTPKAPQVDGILGINDNAKTSTHRSVSPQDRPTCFRLYRDGSIERHGWVYALISWRWNRT